MTNTSVRMQRIVFASALVALTSCAHDLTFLDSRDAAVDAMAADSEAPDAAAVCRSPADQLACDPVRNCNCAAGQTCAAPDLEAPRIRCTRVGAGAEASACLGPGECRAGLSCVRFTCRRACRSRADCAASELCVTDDARQSVGVCARSNECMINPSAGCAAGVHCRVEQLTQLGESGAAGVAWCEELDGSAGEGADCDTDGCVTGLACEQTGARLRCTRPCTESAQCTGAGRPQCDMSSAVVVDGVRWGRCAP